MDIMLGSQLVAPDGFKTISKAERVHLICYCTTRPRVILVSFVFIPTMRLRWHFIGSNTFSKAITENHQLRAIDSGPGVPPWLIKSDDDLPHAEAVSFRSKRTTYTKIIDSRRKYITCLVDNESSIFEAEDPRTEISKRVRTDAPNQNPARMIFWLMAFLVFGEDGLHPGYHRIGGWIRANSGEEPKRGRPSLSAGKNAGSNIDAIMGKRLADGFLKHAKVGDSWDDIFREVMTHELKLPSYPTDQVGRRKFYDPSGGTVPSIYQFRYWTLKSLTLAETQMSRFGEARHRLDHRASPGSFSAGLSQVFERVEADCYYCEQYPKSFATGLALEKLCICRMRCITSGIFVGFGVSFGSETAAAYKMALLSMAMDKVQFCALFGVAISHDEWPCRGMTPRKVTDRGPGAKEIPDDPSSVRQIVPSYSPRSKSPIESSNPRKRAIKGAPRVIVSELNPVQMIVRELRDAIAFNAQRNMRAHASPEILASRVPLNPLGLWKFYTERGRSVGRSMARDTAIRTYAEKTSAELREDGVYKTDHRYCSELLVKSKYLDQVAVGVHVKIEVYFIAMCVKYLWLDVSGQLFQLEWMPVSFADQEQYFLTSVEQIELAELARVDESAARTSHAAVAAYHNEKVKEETGKNPRGARVFSGRMTASKKDAAESASLRRISKKNEKKAA